MDRGAWWATVHGVAKSWTRPSTPSDRTEFTVDGPPRLVCSPPGFPAAGDLGQMLLLLDTHTALGAGAGGSQARERLRDSEGIT